MMHQRDSRAAEFDQGHAILDELVNVCLLESVVGFEGGKCVKMHDLIREMAVGITRNNPKFMRKDRFQFDELLDEEEWVEDFDKASLMYNNIVEIPEGISPICPRLSTLILSSTPLKLISDSFFAHMRGLRVLDLRDTQIEMLPNSISELENLNALLLGSYVRLCYVPSLRKLKALMELDISRTGIKKVPEGMECLVKLKCLIMHDTGLLEEIPRGLLPRLPRLQCLLLPWHITVELEEVESLKLLEEFQGWIDVDIFYSKWFNKLPPLTFYRIGAGADNSSRYNFFYNYKRQILSGGCTFKRDGVDGVSLPQNIQCLKFYKCKGLSSCLLEDVPLLYHSKDFQKCEIECCDEIESIMRISSTCKFHCNDDDGPLQNLKFLRLHLLPNLIGLIKWEPRALVALPPCGTFSSLKELSISSCHKMKKLFPRKLVVHNLQNLEVIHVSFCYQMKEVIADDEEDETVGSTSSSSGIAFPKLTTIRLWSLSELYSICKGEFICCDSIQEITISTCPKLKRLPLFHPSPSASSSSPSSSSSNNKYTNITAFPKLTSIELYDLPELESIYEGPINCCDSIQSVFISNCPKIKRLPFFNPFVDEKPTISFPRLLYLSLINLPQLPSICNGIMICDSIECISIRGCIQLSRLPLYLILIDGQPSRPPSLEKILIYETEKEWWESLQWDHPNSNNVLRPFLKYI